MSFEITTSFVQAYRDNVIHLAQQKGSRLEMTVRRDPDVVGANYYFERIGATAVKFKTTRHEQTPIISTPHSRRRVTFSTLEWGEAIDNDDRVKTLIDPESEYMKAMAAAMGRVKDQVIIAAAVQNAFAGQDGATAVAFPAAQLVPDTALGNLNTLEAGANDAGHLSPQRMLKIGRLFALNDVDPDEERFIVVGARQIWDDLLKYVTVQSADYNTLKAIAAGAVDTYEGFKIILSNLLLLAGGTNLDVYGNGVPLITGATAGDRYDMAYTREGLGLAINEEMRTFIERDPGLSYAVRPYAETAFGAVRIEEARVVLAPCIETA